MFRVIKKTYNPKTVRQKTQAPNRRQTNSHITYRQNKNRDSKTEHSVFIKNKNTIPLIVLTYKKYSDVN